MAYVRVRHASMFVGGKKWAEMFENTYHIGSGDEPVYGDEGFAGMTDGAITSTIDVQEIVPVSGISIDAVSLILQKQDVDITAGLFGSKLYTATYRCTDGDLKSDAKTGMLTGGFKFFGGIPTQT